MNKTIFVFLLFACFVGYSQSTDNLIPRQYLFDGEQRFAYQLSPEGDILYFQKTTSRSIFFCYTIFPDSIHEMKVSINYQDWSPISNGILAISQDSIARPVIISNEGNIKFIKTPSKAKNIKILDKRPMDRFALQIQCFNEAESGIYRFDAHVHTFNKISESQLDKTVFFDGKLNIVAAHTNFQDKGNSILEYNAATNLWDTIIMDEFSLELRTHKMFFGDLTKVISVSSDGNVIYYTTNHHSDKSQLYAYNRQSHETITTASHPDVDLLPFGFSLDSDGHVTSVVGLYAKTIRIITDSSFTNDLRFLENKIKGDISFAGQSSDGYQWLIRELSGGPVNYYLFDRRESKLTFLQNDYPSLSSYKLSSRHAFAITTRDGLKIPLHVYLPQGSDQNSDGIPDKQLPTVLYIHGGPWVGIAHWNSYFQWRNFQLLANRGYAVINCEFRGSSGLGKDFIKKSYKKFGTDMIYDHVDIANWAVDMGIAEKDKIGIWGWSYGGYAAMAGLAFSPETYACGLAMYGISDLEAFCKTDFANNYYWKTRVGDAMLDSNLLKAQSPINYVDSIRVPLLLTTGSKDDKVPQSQSDLMAVEMKQSGKDVIYFYYPDEPHDYRKPESWISYWAVAEKFLSNHLGGRYLPQGDDILKSDMIIVEGQESKLFEN